MTHHRSRVLAFGELVENAKKIDGREHVSPAVVLGFGQVEQFRGQLRLRSDHAGRKVQGWDT